MLTIDVQLEAELINGSNNWIDTGNFYRETGESANCRVFYSLSSTDAGVFEDTTMTIKLSDIFDNIVNFVGVILPTGFNYETTSVGTDKFLTVTFPTPTPAGQSGYLEFIVQSETFRGPNGELIPSTVTIEGDFANSVTGLDEPFTLSENGPTWVVQAENKFEYEKTVTINGNMWIPEDSAYVVEYTLKQTAGSKDDIGSWGVVDAYHVDILPVIPGVTPEIVYAVPNTYTFTGNTVTWDVETEVPTTAKLGVRYPKEQIDAIGGVEAVGEITNKWDVHLSLVGGSETVVNTEASHLILPIPPQIIGTPSGDKIVYGISEFLANGLYYNRGFFEYGYAARYNNSNIWVKNYKIIEQNIYFTFEDGTTETLTGDDYTWSLIYSMSNSPGYLEYNTNLDPNFVVDPNVIFPYPEHQNFPPSNPADYVKQWIVTVDNTIPADDSSLILSVYVALHQRDLSSKRITSLTNEATAEIILPDGTSVTQDMVSVLPFSYVQQIEWAITEFEIREPILNLGEEVIIDISTEFTQKTSVEVYGYNIYVILPEDVLYVSCTEPTIVTPNWNGTTNTLVNIQMPQTLLPLEDHLNQCELTVQVSNSAELGEHVIETYCVINPTQASDDDINMLPFERTSPDIYDFDQNGDTTELVPYDSIDILVSASNVVNVIKMSKSFNDSSFQINNDTQITSNERFEYKFLVRNDSVDEMIYVTVIDVFPFDGDALGSEWAPILDAVPAVPSYITVFYSQSTTPAMEPIGTGGINDWTTIAPSDLSTVKALKFDFGSRVFASGESAEIILKMRAPTSAS